MRKIIQNYGADIEWIHSLAEQFEGEVKGNFIKVSESIHTGSRYYLDCGNGIVALYVDAIYQTDLQLIQKNKTDDFIGLYFNLSPAEAKLSFDTASNMMGSWSYNLSLIDSSLEFQFDVKKGSKIFVFCIFIKKETIKIYAQKNNFFSKIIEKIMNPQHNTFIKWDRMSNKSYHALRDLQKQKIGEPLFNLQMLGTVHLLIADYLQKISEESIVIHHVNKIDLSNIILSQRFLIENIDCHFPSIKFMADKANMSITKFKILFKKITGDSPNSFFMDNKLMKAKELLETRQMTIAEIADKLNFGNPTYFSSKFKKKFGILPFTFKQQL